MMPVLSTNVTPGTSAQRPGNRQQSCLQKLTSHQTEGRKYHNLKNSEPQSHVSHEVAASAESLKDMDIEISYV